MFDYQAGEKYKLTLIMVAIAGAMAGMFFTVLLMPTPEAPQARRQKHQPWMDNPDVTGGGMRMAGAAQAAGPRDGTLPDDAQAQQAQAPAGPVTSATDALSLIEAWIPLAWDLSAGTASTSQEKAILYMTPECAQSYRQNVWTNEISQQIDASGIKSTFRATKVAAGAQQPDGSIVIVVEGEQILNVPDQASRQRPVKVEYLVKKTQEGLRICGISEATQGG